MSYGIRPAEGVNEVISQRLKRYTFLRSDSRRRGRSRVTGREASGSQSAQNHLRTVSTTTSLLDKRSQSSWYARPLSKRENFRIIHGGWHAFFYASSSTPLLETYPPTTSCFRLRRLDHKPPTLVSCGGGGAATSSSTA
ncbi:hypothetical protein EVAR_67450_1 [Eumeta japonica]|uniref:Uncharacterized protein n=1 Tax=Eumeta variegata TaxID=151549 RepID=A0A4C1SZA6_EUMVA|nr:hypothetical protein EVAR_67450_1 [Eumeta japonica]